MGDTKDEITCPACGCAMKKIFLEKQNFYVDICLDGCGGIFLDNREFKKIDESIEDIEPIIEALKDKEFKKPTILTKRICPVCGHNMVTNSLTHTQSVIAEECYTCGGKFFDSGELIQYRGEFLNDAERTKDFKKHLSSLLYKTDFGEDEKFEKFIK